MELIIAFGLIALVIVALLGLRDLLSVYDGRRLVVRSVIGDEVYEGRSVLDRYDRAFRATRLGRRLERELMLASVNRRPLVVAGVGAGVGLVTGIALWTLLAPLLSLAGFAVAVLSIRGYLRRERARRLEAFISQMPELARVLANATNAGLSIPTAIGVAAGELDEPAGSEMQRVAARFGFGAGLDHALAELSDRLPSREVAVLTSTLLVSARSGGSLVSALRDIAETLDQRKETRREVRTTLAQALATGYIVIGLGGLILVALNLLYPGVVEKMTTQLLGQAALVAAGMLFGGGLLVIRKMTRIEP
jgi:tight adherence protein B